MDALLEEAEDGEDGYDAFDVSYEETRQTRDADLPTIGVSGAVNDDVFATPDGDQFISPVERKHYNSDEDNSRHVISPFVAAVKPVTTPPLDTDLETLSDVESYFQDDWLNDSEHDFEKSHVESREGGREVIGMQERVAMLRLRREVDEINKLVADCQLQVQESKRELVKCHDMIDALQAERLSVEAEIQRHEEKKNIAVVMRLKGQVSRISQQIETEKSIEQQIKQTIDKAELALHHAELDQHRNETTAKQLAGMEETFEKQNEVAAVKRLKEEIKTAAAADAARKIKQREETEAAERAEQKRRDLIADAQLSQAKTARFLEETLSRMRQQDVANHKQNSEMMKQRMQSLLRLKTNIQDNRDSMRALQMIRNKHKSIADCEEKKERQKATEEGLNPVEVLMKKKRLQALFKEKEEFSKQQEKNKVNIVDKLLREQEQAKKREKKDQQPQWQSKQETKKSSHDIVTSSVGVHVDIEAAQNKEVVDIDGEEKAETEMKDMLSPANQAASILTSVESDQDARVEDVQLGGPSMGVQGLWQPEDHLLPSFDQDKHKNKLEAEMMDRVMQKLKESVVITQVAAGKEFKGRPFNSKPEVIIFEDFDVGKTYHKKVVLTNVSYTINYCKLQGMSDSLANSIDITFDPPGVMSAGMTCEMIVTFIPEVNSDLSGEVFFLAQTGSFSVPIQCVTKKCKLSVSSSCVEFRPACVGETRRRTFQLKNEGALGTRYVIKQISDVDSSDQGSVSLQFSQPGRNSVSEIDSTDTADGANVSSEHEQQISLGSLQLNTNDTNLLSKTIDHVSSSLLHTVVEREDEGEDEGEEKAESEGASDKRDEGKKSDKELGDQSETKSTAVSLVDDPMVIETESLKQSQVTVQSLVTAELTASSQLLSEQLQEKQDAQNASELEQSLGPAEYPLKFGVNAKSFLDPHSSLDIEVIFTPVTAGNFEKKYRIVFSEQATEEIIITVTGSAIDLPIYVEKQVIQLKVCMLDHLYQEAVLVHNRSATALRVTFTVPPALRDHIEILPKHGLVQGESSFSAQLKFLPRRSILEVCSERLNVHTGKLDIPVTIQVADQTRPVFFTVQAVVTSTDLEFDTTNIDFGTCTIYEAVVSTIRLSNKSVLPQAYGFVQLPKGVDVQPNDGFGTLLPEETISLDIIFSPEKPKEYKLTLTCKSGIGREFQINFVAIAILPALCLSHNVIDFCPTPIEDSRSTLVYVENPIHSPLSEESIRGQAPPSLPMAFEFAVPQGYPLYISPTVGIVQPGERHQVSVTFAPRLDRGAVMAHAWNLAKEKALLAAKVNREAAEMAAAKEAEEKSQLQSQGAGKKKRGVDRKGASSGMKMAPRCSTSMTNKRGQEQKEVSQPVEGSDEYWEASSALLRTFNNESTRLFVPCFVAAIKKSDKLDYRPDDTLHLEVSLPTVRPKLVLDRGSNIVDFGPVCKGHMKLKTVVLKNISDQVLTSLCVV
ncbi:cilia- and flagella-associated protein 74-like isoform X2 [Corticium candelabrum]|uniref:cilia- and flagella-associated protein 74-like isoform X2 n=1 Tax=Corticium candelabrum TaxID=121492 RepID=UPI002E274C38|nr:cilia- and flagella-associated protein 74-like isoform X2 [Corticium candelabrum]